jgi:hypothetical protein
VIDRTQHSTRCALDAIRRRLPFRLREIHPDNDSSVINRLLLDYCRQNQIAVSRSRPLKKNDNCWVEQKNWTHVRKLVGYHRLSGELQHRLLKDLYRVWSLWRNYFQPVMRLESKTRTGSKVHRRYDVPATPCQRLLASGQLSAMARQSLEQRYASLNPVPAAETDRAASERAAQNHPPQGNRPGCRTETQPPFSYLLRDSTGRRSVTG